MAGRKVSKEKEKDPVRTNSSFKPSVFYSVPQCSTFPTIHLTSAGLNWRSVLIRETVSLVWHEKNVNQSLALGCVMSICHQHQRFIAWLSSLQNKVKTHHEGSLCCGSDCFRVRAEVWWELTALCSINSFRDFFTLLLEASRSNLLFSKTWKVNLII